MRLDKLQCKKVLVQAFGSKSEMVEATKKRGKGPRSFHKVFITEDQHNQLIVTPKRVKFVETKEPVKNLENEFCAEVMEKRCGKIREVIEGIASELRVQIPESTIMKLKNGDISYLQKELGGWNIRKREMLKAKRRANKNEPQLRNKASLYGESGLDVAAVSMNVATKAPVMKNKPPEVEVPRKNVLQKGVNQIRHSYTVRLKLQQQDETHVNVSQKLKEIFNVWKSADQSSVLLPL